MTGVCLGITRARKRAEIDLWTSAKEAREGVNVETRDYEQERVKPFCREHVEGVSWDEWVFEKVKKAKDRRWLAERDEWEEVEMCLRFMRVLICPQASSSCVPSAAVAMGISSESSLLFSFHSSKN